MKKKNEIKISQCPSCAKCYKSERGLKMHIAVKHAEKSLTEWLSQDGAVLLKPNNELFLQYYVVNDATRGNATRSYAMANGIELDTLSQVRDVEVKYNPKTEEFDCVDKTGTSEREIVESRCAVNSSMLLRRSKVDARRTQILNELLNEVIVDRELSRVILENPVGESNKIAAIKEFNKLKGRILDKSISLEVKTSLSELAEMALNGGKKQDAEVIDVKPKGS